jgi:hypothetical protein
MSELMGGMTSMISASLGALVYPRVRPRGHEVGCEPRQSRARQINRHFCRRGASEGLRLLRMNWGGVAMYRSKGRRYREGTF